MKKLFQNLSNINKYLLVLLGFCIPVSTALTNVVLGLLIFFWILDNIPDRFRKWGQILKTNPVALMGIAVFFIHVAGIFYTEGEKEKIIESLSDGVKFLFIGMVMIYFKDEKFRPAFLFSFLCAMAVTLVLSYLLWLNLLPDVIPVKGTPSNCVIFHDHIKQNIFMACAAFFAALWARKPGIGPLEGWCWGLISLLALFNVLFMVQGRTGHVIIIVLSIYYLVTWNKAKSLATGALILVLFGAFAWQNPSNPLISRAHTVIKEVREWDHEKPADRKSSSGLRLEWWVNSLKLIKKDPVLGTGTGSFKAVYIDLVKHTGMQQTDNPHNEFLMTTVQFGVVGLLVMIGFFGVQWRHAGFSGRQPQVAMTRGFILLMLIACMTASPLQDNAEGWFFVFMSGFFFARLGTGRTGVDFTAMFWPKKTADGYFS
jgi:O-antigen ligase